MKIIIDSGMRWSYFQWFMLGFYELEKRGLVDLRNAFAQSWSTVA